MLFNLINSKALPLISEHSLSVLMRDNGAASVRFAEDRQVYLTRWIRDVVRNWPQGFYDAMGDSPLSRLYSTARVLLKPGGLVAETIEATQAETTGLFDPVADLAIRLRDAHEAFVLSPAFLPIACEIFVHHTLVDVSKGANTRQARVVRAERWLRDFAEWFERLGGTNLPLPPDPTVLWKIFKRSYESRIKSVFVAMSFREDQTLKDVKQAIKESIANFNTKHPNAHFDPVIVDELKGASYEIPARVFQKIDESSLVIADLTDERPNVYCEVGYAKSRGIPFILTFHKKKSSRTRPPWDRKDEDGNKVHFDLAAFRYVAYENPMNLRDQLAVELDALFESEP
jgi:nucleoside 2-deoxyribosyltransferase